MHTDEGGQRGNFEVSVNSSEEDKIIERTVHSGMLEWRQQSAGAGDNEILSG